MQNKHSQTTKQGDKIVLGLILTLVGTGLSVYGLQSHAWGVIEGIISGVGFMLMVFP